MKDTTNGDYKSIHKKFWKDFGIENHDEYHHLYAQSDAILLIDAFDSFRENCIEIYKLDPAHFHSPSALSWKACLKKTEVELELLTNIDMLIMVENGIRSGMWHVIL